MAHSTRKPLAISPKPKTPPAEPAAPKFRSARWRDLRALAARFSAVPPETETDEGAATEAASKALVAMVTMIDRWGDDVAESIEAFSARLEDISKGKPRPTPRAIDPNDGTLDGPDTAALGLTPPPMISAANQEPDYRAAEPAQLARMLVLEGHAADVDPIYFGLQAAAETIGEAAFNQDMHDLGAAQREGYLLAQRVHVLAELHRRSRAWLLAELRAAEGIAAGRRAS